MKSVEQLYEEKLQELIRLGEIKIEDSIASLSTSEPSPSEPESLKDKTKDTAQDILEDHDGKMKKTDLKEKTKQELKDNGDLENISDSEADKAIDDAIKELEDEGELKSDDKGNVTSSDEEEEPEHEDEDEEGKGKNDKDEDKEEESDSGKEDKDKEKEDKDKKEEEEPEDDKSKPEEEEEKDQDQKEQQVPQEKKPKIPSIKKMKDAIFTVLQHDDKTEDELIADTKEYFSMED